MTTAIATDNTAAILNKIGEVSTIEEIKTLIKQIDALKVALESVNLFHEKSIMYAKLEADALIKAVELGGLNQLRGAHRQTAEWLYGLSEQERQRYIDMCGDGLTIDQIYKREVGDPKKVNELIDKIERKRNELVQEAKENGIIDMKPFCEEVRDAFKFDKRSIGEDIIDGTRNKLRKAGAVGIGDDGIYVMAKPENSDEVKKAILLRYESICNDYKSIKEIAKASGVKMSYKEFDSGAHWSYANNGYIINILLAFIDMGVISDANECISAIDRTNFSKEVDHIKKVFRRSREDYIKSQYAQLFGEEREET